MVDAAQTLKACVWYSVDKRWHPTHELSAIFQTADYWRERSGTTGLFYLVMAADGSASIFDYGKETRYLSEAAARMAWEMTHG